MYRGGPVPTVDMGECATGQIKMKKTEWFCMLIMLKVVTQNSYAECSIM